MEIISLGSCSVAYQLKKHNLRIYAYPFDWIYPKFATINVLLNSEFDKFTKFKDTKKKSFNHNLDDNLRISKKMGTLIIENWHGIKFYHDFSYKMSFYDQYQEICEKYRRRIDRLYEAIKTKKNIHFIRTVDNPKKIHIDDIQKFRQIIQNLNPNLNYRLTIIIHNPGNLKLKIIKNKIKNIIFINDISKFENWSRPNIGWNKIF